MRRQNEYDFDGQPYVVVERHDSGIGPLLLGIALGAGAALLFAPRSGAETRERIKMRARDASDAARERVEDLASAVTERVHDARDAVVDRVDTVRESVRRKRDGLVDAFDAGRSAAHQARLELERKLAERKGSDVSSSADLDQG